VVGHDRHSTVIQRTPLFAVAGIASTEFCVWLRYNRGGRTEAAWQMSPTGKPAVRLNRILKEPQR
jgi:hypothetical protein